MPPVGGIQLAPNGWQALDQLGLCDAAIKRATQLDHIVVRDLGSGATLTRLGLNNHYASIGRADLLNLLQDTVAKYDSITHHAALISHAVPHKDSVDLVFEDGHCLTGSGLMNGRHLADYGTPSKYRLPPLHLTTLLGDTSELGQVKRLLPETNRGSKP